MTEAATDSPPCPLCDGTGWILVEEDGIDIAKRCECAEERLRERMILRAGIPDRYRHCTLDDFELWNSEDPTLGKA